MNGSVTLATDSRGRVFERDTDDGLPYGTTRIYGCLYRKNQRVLLAEAVGYGLTVAWVTIKSPWVGYVERTEYKGEASESPIVFNLSTRRSRSFHAFGVSDFAMTRTGHFAWIEQRPYSDRPPEVRRDRSQSRSLRYFGTVLDSGPNVDTTSLKVASRSSVSWVNGDRTKSAELR